MIYETNISSSYRNGSTNVSSSYRNGVKQANIDKSRQ